MAKIVVTDDPEFFHGLTMWEGGEFSAQIRDDALALYFGSGRTAEAGVSLVPLKAARRLRDLLNVATARGHL